MNAGRYTSPGRHSIAIREGEGRIKVILPPGRRYSDTLLWLMFVLGMVMFGLFLSVL